MIRFEARERSNPASMPPSFFYFRLSLSLSPPRCPAFSPLSATSPLALYAVFNRKKKGIPNTNAIVEPNPNFLMIAFVTNKQTKDGKRG